MPDQVQPLLRSGGEVAIGRANRALERSLLEGTERRSAEPGSASRRDLQGEPVLTVHVQGVALHVPRDRATADSGGVWIGVRPEKVFLAAAGTETQDSSNLLRDGVVTDVSFIGVSTQYLVKMTWGQELMVFEQNTGARPSFRVGDRVDLHWMPDHTFLLDASQDATAGSELEDAS